MVSVFGNQTQGFKDIGLALPAIAIFNKKAQTKHYNQKLEEYNALFPMPTDCDSLKATIAQIKATREQKIKDKANSKAKSTKNDLQDEIVILTNMDKDYSAKLTEICAQKIVTTNETVASNQTQSKVDTTSSDAQTIAAPVSQTVQDIAATDTQPITSTKKNYLPWIIGGLLVVGIGYFVIRKKD